MQRGAITAWEVLLVLKLSYSFYPDYVLSHISGTNGFTLYYSLLLDVQNSIGQEMVQMLFTSGMYCAVRENNGHQIACEHVELVALCREKEEGQEEKLVAFENQGECWQS